MENNLYYIPKLSEFHIGFEYEYQEEVNGEFKPKVFYGFDEKEFNAWIRVNVYTPDCIAPIFYRVKTLDQSDIESLGWIDGKTRGMTPFIFNELDPNNEFQLYYQFDNQFAQIYNYHSEFVFQGFIKNKQELIKLMKQLNIK